MSGLCVYMACISIIGRNYNFLYRHDKTVVVHHSKIFICCHKRKERCHQSVDNNVVAYHNKQMT